MSQKLTADQLLCLAYARADLRAAFRAAFLLDSEFCAIVSVAREPMVTRIKLAWWREEGLRRAVRGTEIGDAALLLHDYLPCVIALLDAWDAVLDDSASAESARARGVALFAVVAAIAQAELTDAAQDAARGWGLVDHGIRIGSQHMLTEAAANIGKAGLQHLRGPLKPLGVLAVLAQSDCARGLARMHRLGSPRRMAIALRFALSIY